LFITSFLGFGLFHESVACIFSGLYGLFWAVMSVQRKKMAFYCNATNIVLAVIVLMYGISALYGVDSGMGLIGFCKMLTPFFFLCLAMQLTKEERSELVGLIPGLGSFMVVIGMVSYFISPLQSFFYEANRLGGFFQYANVFALFCLVGMILLIAETKVLAVNAQSNKEKVCFWGKLILLMLGIFLAGSRTVFVLFVCATLCLAVKRKEIRIPLLGMLGVMFAGVLIYVFFTGNVQNVGRFLTTSLSSSTFVGRLLYAKDGLKILLDHPLGLGYLGYYYMEPSVQTGVYSVRYIHNDFLQMMLDIGVVPGILFIFVFFKNIFTKSREFYQRLTLLVMGIAFLMDFDLEFTSMWFLVILLFDCFEGKKELNIAAGGKLAFYKVIAGIVAVVSLYIGGAMLPRHVGNVEMTASFLPFYTEANTEVLAMETDLEQGVTLAERILKQNAYVAEAYDVLAMAAFGQGDYSKMSELKKQSVSLRKYEIEGYERYILLLSQAITLANEQGDMETAGKLLIDVVDVSVQIKSVEAETDTLAYQIRDLPDFELDEEIVKYIKQVEGVLGK